MPPSLSTRIRRVARERLGYEELRPGQEEAAASVVAGRDTLCVLPTGSGKSAIYQIAALLLPGPTVVVSPLIALQRDQVESIRAHDAAEAAQLNSTLSAGAREETLETLEQGELEFLFLAPEQLASAETLERLRAAGPSLVVVDEAHCVSEWGHEFRPDYLRLGAAVEALGRPVVLALTATAAPPVREEIVERLGLRDPLLVVRGFDRPNIRLAVRHHHEEAPKLRALVERAVAAPKPGIVYTATRRRAGELAEALEAEGLRACAYHAGLGKAERERVQEAFMADGLDVIVATVAFGMGVDKPNVRFVLHAEISDSVDAYYQEVGRAGRDGEPAEAILFYRPQDLGLRRFQAGSGRVALEEVEAVAEAVAEAEGSVELAELKGETGLSDSKLTVALGRLEDADVVRVEATGEVAAERGADPQRAAEEAVAAQERHRELERSRVEMMRGYAETRGCRRAYVLAYFGEAYEPPCGRCDNCEAGLPQEVEAAAVPFPVGARVAHEQFGEGAVQRYEGDLVTVLFEDVGYRTLSVELAAGGLLRTLA